MCNCYTATLLISICLSFVHWLKLKNSKMWIFLNKILPSILYHKYCTWLAFVTNQTTVISVKIQWVIIILMNSSRQCNICVYCICGLLLAYIVSCYRQVYGEGADLGLWMVWPHAASVFIILVSLACHPTWQGWLAHTSYLEGVHLMTLKASSTLTLTHNTVKTFLFPDKTGQGTSWMDKFLVPVGLLIEVRQLSQIKKDGGGYLFRSWHTD